MKRVLFLIMGVMTWILAYSASPIYQSAKVAIDENLLLKNATLTFDITAIQNANPSYNNLGIGFNATKDSDPTKEKALKLYKGNRESGTLLLERYEERLQNEVLFRAGNEVTLSFDDIKLEAGEKYTLYVYYIFFVSPVNEVNFLLKLQTMTAYSYDDPIVIEFTAESVENSTLNMVSFFPSQENSIKTLNQVEVEFDSELTLVNRSGIKASENGVNIASPISVAVNNDNKKQLLISFDNITLYKTHSYEIEIPENCVVASDDNQISNEAIRINLTGDSWKYLPKGRVYPPSNSEILASPLIQIPMSFPEGYGFVALSSGPEVFKGYWYEGEDKENTTEVEVVINTSANGLEVNPQFPAVPGKTYTFVFPEGQVIPRSLSDRSKLGDTSNSTYTLTYYTPAVEDIASVSFAELNPEDIAVGKIEKLSFKINPYVYNEDEYGVANMGAKAILYVNNDEAPMAEYPLEIVNTDNGRILQSKEDINLSLYEGSTYRFVIPANTIVPNHAMFRPYGGNKEQSIVYTGTTPTNVYVTYSIVNAGSFKKAEAINKPVTVEFVPEIDWIVKEVLFNNTPVEWEGNSYTTEVLTEDASISVEYAYEKEIPFLDITVGVDGITVDGTDYLVFSEMGDVVIDNLNGSEHIVVYNMAGQMLGEHTMMGGNNRVQIPLPEGIYIIRVNDTAFKIKH